MSAYAPLLAVLVALLVGLAVGKAWERYKLRDGRWIDRRRLRETPHYMLGLNFLADNQIDQAIDELTHASSSDTDALEIQMILGNLYRQKGQVGRAINVHQALLQRTDLRTLEHAYVLLCLGLDFRHGGFVDRALEAFQGVVRLDRLNRYAFVNLQKLYEDQHQWAEAARVREQIAAIDSRQREEDQQILGFLRNEMGSVQAASGDVSGATKSFQDVTPSCRRRTASAGIRSAPRCAASQPARTRHPPGGVAGAERAWSGLGSCSAVRGAHAQRRVLSRPARLRALPVQKHRAALALSAMPRVEHVRGGADCSSEGHNRG
jgi:tetratricopeptide (TPR) repeat protein